MTYAAVCAIAAAVAAIVSAAIVTLVGRARPGQTSVGGGWSVGRECEQVELLRRHGDAWVTHSWRPQGHPDIQEALDTPGLAVRRGGVVEEGRQ
jgi:hypothetical protein